MKHKKTFLGIGWKFPPTFDKSSKSVQMVSEEEDIRESLHILLSTQPGERIMRPEYGCDTKQIVFNTTSTNNLTLLKRAISRSILLFEPRIDLDTIDIQVSQDVDGLLLVNIHYIIRLSNSRRNLVYPFYILEGTEIRLKTG